MLKICIGKQNCEDWFDTDSNRDSDWRTGSVLFRVPAWLEARFSSVTRLDSGLARGSMLARGSLLCLKLSSISSSVFLETSAHLGSSRDSTRLCSSRYQGIGSDRLRKLRWTWLGLVFVGACNQDKCAASSGSMTFFLQTDFRTALFSSVRCFLCI